MYIHMGLHHREGTQATKTELRCGCKVYAHTRQVNATSEGFHYAYFSPSRPPPPSIHHLLPSDCVKRSLPDIGMHWQRTF